MKNFDKVVTFGCSYMHGDAINNGAGGALGSLFKPAVVLGRLLNCKNEDTAHSGSSNERIIRNVYNWVESNTESKKPLLVIGLSGTARYSFWSSHRELWYELSPANVDSYDDEALKRTNDKLTDGIGSVKDLRYWIEYYVKWLYNTDVEDKKLQRTIVMLHHYLKANNCDYVLLNSLQDSLGDIKDRINYISFQDETYTGEDCWQKYLMWQMEHIDNEIFEDGRGKSTQIYRSAFPPYGKRFCAGHPSPDAIKELCDRIYEELDK